MDSEQIIKEANEYIDNFERGHKILGSWLALALIILGLIFIGIYSYQYVHNGEKIHQANAELNKALNEHEGNEILSSVIDAKIQLARADSKRLNPGYYSWAGGFIVMGIVLLITRNLRQRHVKLMRGLLKLVQKNS